MTPENETTEISVTVTTRTTYRFPGYPNRKCSAHGDPLCVNCARNPSSCGDDTPDDAPRGCGVYGETGMHWDTCPNRIR